MSVKVASNRLIVPSFRDSGFYQQLFLRVSDFQELGKRLIYEAKKAFAFRQTKILEEIGLLLSTLPNREHQLIGQYYVGWCEYEKGGNPKAVFEKVIEESQTYKAKALMSLAALEARSGDYMSEMRHFAEAIKRAESLTTFIRASKAIAVIKAKEGYRKQSLQDLENIVPMLRYVSSDVCFDSLNSLAVELCEAGRIQEAGNISRIVLASPYAFAYPEWRDTGQEIEVRGYHSRASVSVAIAFAEKPQPKNLLRWPKEDTQKPAYDPLPSAATITEMAAWKKKMGKEPNGDVKLPKNMNAADMVVMLMNIITKDDDPDEEKLRKVLEYTIKVFSGK